MIDCSEKEIKVWSRWNIREYESKSFYSCLKR